MRRAIGGLAAAVILLGVATVSPACADGLERSALGPRTVRYTYEVTVTPPAQAKVVEIAIPMPREDDQTVLDIDLAGPGTASVRPLPGGDRMAHWRIEKAGEPLVVRQTGTVARREVHAETARADGTAIDRDVFAAALAPSPSVQINDEVRAIAQRETAGKEGVVARAHALYDWVYDHMAYDKSVPGWGLGDIPYCLKVGKGNYFFGALSGNRILFSRLRDDALSLGDADPPRNYFIYPVVRADGVELKDGVTWRFTYQDR